MKMRYVVIGYTVVIMLLLCFVYNEIMNKKEFEIDMVYYNRQLQNVVDELGKDEKPDEIEGRYGCVIIFTEDEAYEQKLNDYISSGSIIFDYMENDNVQGKIIWQERMNQYEELQKDTDRTMLIFTIVLALCGYAFLAVMYYIYIRPFKVLKRFSQEIAKGNLDFKLPIERGNIFGVFTESFDIMREELKSAREREYKANISKKELVAELSHDIKTPVSTIKATCEVMQVTEDNEATKKKIDVILNKADMIDQLVGNMFHATMEELNALKVEPSEESALCIYDMFNDLKYYGSIIIDNEIPECLVYMDKLRMKQVIDNIVNNSYKYAGTDIHISFREENKSEDGNSGICITVRDAGKGVSKEELALITEKFYRGTNAKGKSGSGIGLYLSNIFMKQMGGDMGYYNDNGFVVELFLRKI